MADEHAWLPLVQVPTALEALLFRTTSASSETSDEVVELARAVVGPSVDELGDGYRMPRRALTRASVCLGCKVAIGPEDPIVYVIEAGRNADERVGLSPNTPRRPDRFTAYCAACEGWWTWAGDHGSRTTCRSCERPIAVVRRTWRGFFLWTFQRPEPRPACSAECARDARNARRRAKRALAPRACERCGESYQPARRDARYCTGRCRVAALRERRAADMQPHG